MRLLPRIALFVLAILLGAGLLAAWLVPPQLDWARYRGTIAQLASTRLGLPVTIEGPVTLRLLPEPVLTAGKISVGNPATDGMLIRVQALRLRLALWPLLSGRIDARELVLHRPDLHIPWPAPPGMLARGRRCGSPPLPRGWRTAGSPSASSPSPVSTARCPASIPAPFAPRSPRTLPASAGR